MSIRRFRSWLARKIAPKVTVHYHDVRDTLVEALHKWNRKSD